MSLWVLDTDSISLIQRDYPLIVQRFNALSYEEVAVTIISVEEQMRGRLNGIKRASSPEQQISAYARLRETTNYFNGVKLLDFDRPASACYEDLYQIRLTTHKSRRGSPCPPRPPRLVWGGHGEPLQTVTV